MAHSTKQLLLCVHDARSFTKIETVANDLGVGIVREDNSEALVKNAAFAQADAILIEVIESGADLSCLLDACQKQGGNVPVIAFLRQSSSSDAVRLSRSGVFDCLDNSSTTTEICSALEAAFSERIRTRPSVAAIQTPAPDEWRRHLVGQSHPMEHVSTVIRLVAARRCTVLITGETGTGKEMAARAIHMASDRSRKPMVAVNCSAIPENLIEAELFGHVKGAYTGANGSRIGRFEQANGGTLFLDEIGDLPFDLQSKLLRALQEKEIQRLGSSETVKVDVRVIAATNADLPALIRQGRFREDLYYRLNVVPVHMPALKDRACDIPLLAEHFIRKICEGERIETKQVSRDALEILASYAWPGNVRQLENVVEHAIVMSGDRNLLHASDFALPQSTVSRKPDQISVPSHHQDLSDEGLDFTEALRQFERAILHQALNRAQGNKTLAADMLRLPRTTLIHKLRVLDRAVA